MSWWVAFVADEVLAGEIFANPNLSAPMVRANLAVAAVVEVIRTCVGRLLFALIAAEDYRV